MKKEIFRGALIGVVGFGLLAGNAFASLENDRPLDVNVTGLQTNLNDIMPTNPFDANDDQSKAAIFTTPETNVVSSFVFTDWGASVDQSGFEFGLYSYSNYDLTIDIFSGAMGGGAQTAIQFLGDGSVRKAGLPATTVVGFGDTFGFYYTAFENGNGTGDLVTYYSEDDRNGSYGAAFLAFQGTGSEELNVPIFGTQPLDPNDWLVTFDSTSFKDFNDAVVLVEGMNAAVPEPTTMLLFGTGLIGLAGVARRRKLKK